LVAKDFSFMPKSFEDLMLAKLDTLLRVVTVGMTKGMKQGEQIAVLDRVGLSPSEIAGLLGTTRNTVNVALSNLRKHRRTKGKGASRRRP
jgi:DNA-directed RNA polymerase specialized sigma24 family protein